MRDNFIIGGVIVSIIGITMILVIQFFTFREISFLKNLNTLSIAGYNREIMQDVLDDLIIKHKEIEADGKKKSKK